MTYQLPENYVLAGNYGTANASDWGTATALDYGTANAGAWGTATAGFKGTATAGFGGTTTAGIGGKISIDYWDGTRIRTKVGYIGEDGLEPNTPYKLDETFNFVKA